VFTSSVPTPRAGNVGATNHLTRRSMRDLCTWVRFERSTPDAHRANKPNIAWVEWLMGYPPDYTNVFHKVASAK